MAKATVVRAETPVVTLKDLKPGTFFTFYNRLFPAVVRYLLLEPQDHSVYLRYARVEDGEVHCTNVVTHRVVPEGTQPEPKVEKIVLEMTQREADALRSALGALNGPAMRAAAGYDSHYLLQDIFDVLADHTEQYEGWHPIVPRGCD
jgi:hypothetical protein